MCGFASSLELTSSGAAPAPGADVPAMTATLGHRGPDDDGLAVDGPFQVGFRRLSIVDLDGGHQPMRSPDGRWLLVFNGEIYNHVELRAELRALGETFTTGSDTEVLLAHWRRHGTDGLLRLRGMYAFVVWDAVAQELHAARDPFGIKPLYWAVDRGRLLLASEAKAIRTELDAIGVDAGQLQRYLQFQYVPGPATLTPGVQALPPGSWLVAGPGRAPVVERFWVPTFQPGAAPAPPEPAIRAALRGSVRAHLRADVPVGAFLSGGIDSTSLVALAREATPALETFTVGFDRPGFSEVELAQRSAEALGVVNTSRLIGHEEFADALPRIVWHLDDPVADPSVVPLWHLAALAASRVKVVLSGEGADELFGGYRVYGHQHALLRGLRALPAPARRALAGLAAALPQGQPGAGLLARGAVRLEDWYLGNARIFGRDELDGLLRLGGRPAADPREVTDPVWHTTRGLDPVTRMQAVDLRTWLVGDILTKADRMSMAHGLEVRVPFLDRDVWAVAAGLPASAKHGRGTTKPALRRAMAGLLPEGVAERPKLGFPVPLRAWLAHELYGWARDVIARSQAGDLLDTSVALALLERHRGGQADLSRRIWAVLVFCLWHELVVEGRVPAGWNGSRHGIAA
jgi:asparagine synthase (glutamine-hydrolysing)